MKKLFTILFIFLAFSLTFDVYAFTTVSDLCTNSASTTQTFSYTGSDQSFTLPSVENIAFKVWGAGGRGDAYPGRGLGGPGGFVQGVFSRSAISSSSSLVVTVGQGGDSSTGSRTYGNGGAGLIGDGRNFGSGGGMSALSTASLADPSLVSVSDLVAIAGGGGTAPMLTTAGSYAGFGGGLAGGDGFGSNGGAFVGLGGTQTAGGVASGDGNDGAFLLGGDAVSNGGAGGGGYYGGASGALGPNDEGSGGGGSGYISPTVSDSSFMTGTGTTSPNTTDSFYVAGVANGGTDGGQQGGNGLVVLCYVTAYDVSSYSSTISEVGGVSTFDVVLLSQPTEDVVIDLSPSIAGEITLSSSSLTFTNLNWDTAQTVTITGVDDTDVGDTSVDIDISINTASSPSAFHSLADQVHTVTLLSDDVGTPDLQSTSDTGSSSTDDITSDSTPTIDVACTTGTTVNLYAQGTPDTLVGSTTCPASGTASITTSSLTDGNYTFYANETDTAGNTGTNSGTLGVVVVDTIAPSAGTIASVDGVTSAPYLTNDDEPSVVINATTGTTVAIPGWTCTPTPVTGTTATCTPDAPLAEGTTSIAPTITDVAGNSTSMTAVDVVVDTTAPGVATVDANDTNDTTPEVTGTLPAPTAATDTVSVTINGTTYTATNNGDGTWTLPDNTISPALTDGTYDVQVVVTDAAGNAATSTVPSALTVDTTAPVTPTIDSFRKGDTEITGTGEVGATIDISPFTCANAPVVVDANGEWTCDTPSPEPEERDTITATSTDAAGNTSTDTYTVPSTRSSSSGGGSVSYVCKDAEATNYVALGVHSQTLCEYEEETTSEIEEEVTPVVPTTNPETSQTLGQGYQCSASQILTQNMKAGDRNGQYSSWENATINEVKILQAHMNRLGFASGPEDGILGPITDGAIKRMQAYLGTFQDGYVGPITRSLINNSCASEEVKEIEEEVIVVETPVVETVIIEDAKCFINYTRLIKRGMIGEDVRQAQECMDSLGHPTGPFDGIYGGLTYAGIISYQKANNLRVDGLIGPETAGHLNALSGVALDGVTAL